MAKTPKQAGEEMVESAKSKSGRITGGREPGGLSSGAGQPVPDAWLEQVRNPTK